MKVAFFDYWTLGIINFLPLRDELESRGIECVLIHIGSFRNECPKEEIIEGLVCRDISYYNTNMVYTMIEKEAPDVIVTLNTTYIFDRAVVLASRKLGIKSVFMMHGVRTYNDEGTAQYLSDSKKVNNGLIKKLSKAGKYFNKVIPNYAYSLLKANPAKIYNFHFLNVVYSYFKDPAKSFYYPSFADELIHDKCLIYCNNERKYYTEVGYPNEKIVVTGSPKYDSLYLRLNNNELVYDKMDEEIKNFLCNDKYALLLEDSFPESGNLGGVTNEIRNDYIDKIGKKVGDMGFKLVVKLHPTTLDKNIKTSSENILITKKSLDELIFNAEFCIGQYSTTISNCIIMNKPVVKPHWGQFSNILKFHCDIGVSNLWDNFDSAIDISINDAARKSYLDEYVSVLGPFSNKIIADNIVD